MNILVVVDRPQDWPSEFEGAEVVLASEYLCDQRFIERRRAKVFNLCNSYQYQTTGYYVSLLAEARGHRPLPAVITIEDLRISSMQRWAAEGIGSLVQRSLKGIKADRFTLSIYFGHNMARTYDRLASAIFNRFPAPLLRAEFVRTAEQWHLRGVAVIASGEVPDTHRPFVGMQAKRYFERPARRTPRAPRYDMAILVDPEERDSPSSPEAIERFIAAARKHDIAAWTIGRHELGRLAEYDALFIRATTNVNHFTYRFARRAEALGLVVIDDPVSIVRCTNKVYQAEIFARHQLACPKTMVVARGNVREAVQRLGLPCVVKLPDSSFSAGVRKAETMEELDSIVAGYFAQSELLVVQSFIPSEFDWRVGVLDGKPIFVCKYFMSKGHWQIQQVTSQGTREMGTFVTLAVEFAPKDVVDLALRAARAIGNGLYGVDIKETPYGLMVMEVNDNPNIDAGVEDQILKGALYERVMDVFYERLQQQRS